MSEQAIIAKYGSVKAFQSSAGLNPDGKCGRRTLRNFELVQAGKAPIPEGRARVSTVYGRFTYTKVPDSRNIKLTGNWEAKNIASFELHTGQTRRFHKDVGAEFVDVFRRACEAAGETPKSVQTFVPRFTNGLKKLSMHSWGIAVDFDPQENPMGGHNSWMRTNAGQRFVEVFEAAGWTWGGRWKMKDDMHFQRAYV